MIKPIKVSPLDTTQFAYFECKNCGYKNELFFTNKVINVDSKIDLDYLSDTECPNCGEKLGKS